MSSCPHCQEPLTGLGTFCHECGKYTADPTTKGCGLPEPTEKEIQAAIVKYLEAVGCHVVDTSQPRATMITEGLSDLVVFAPGRLVFAEVKRPGGKLREAQKRFRGWCERAGADYAVWTSVDDAQAWLHGPDQEAA